MTTTISPLLAPVITLNIWTLLVEVYMFATRIPAVPKHKAPQGNTALKEDFNRHLPASVRWKADNYNNLLEQPTQFYAVTLALALMGDESMGSWALAWAYVGVRMLHSVWHVSINDLKYRFFLFAISGFVLAGLTSRAALLVSRG